MLNRVAARLAAKVARFHDFKEARHDRICVSSNSTSVALAGIAMVSVPSDSDGKYFEPYRSSE